MKDRIALVLSLLAPLGLLGCFDPILGPCKVDEQCLLKDGTDGKCIPAGDGKNYCIFPASDCASTWRWDALAPLNLRNTCVDNSLVPQDGGTDANRLDG